MKDYWVSVTPLMDVHTFDPRQHPSLLERVEGYRHKIIQKGGESLLENYSPKRLDFSAQEAISLFLKDDIIKGFCTAWNRDFFGADSLRILNRYWRDREMRTSGYPKAPFPPHAFACIQHQCQLAQQRGFEWAFFSREVGAKSYCEKFTDILNQSEQFGEWKMSPRLIQVTPDAAASSSWQWVVYRSLKPSRQQVPWDSFKISSAKNIGQHSPAL